MRRANVCFVSYLDQDNLGVGYIASSLLETDHFNITLVDIREPTSEIVREIAVARPVIVGFSIVFQAHLPEFRELTAVLRGHGVDCHFTAGGHYPSLRYDELMRLIPELDSVVLFEGEHTVVELAEALRKNDEWRGIDGIAYRADGTVIRNRLRPLEDDLDRFPLPIRRSVRPEILGHRVVNLLAGRGCYYNCSFCSIHRFYSQPRGRSKRVRRPECVAREMQLHYEQEGSTVFLFQDDDFPLVTDQGRDWPSEFCRELREKNLYGHVMWKISSRADEVSEAVFSRLMDHGLGMVYMGIESGTTQGLLLMNKGITPDDSLRASGILKRLGIPFEFGFMIFEPFTTFDSLRQDLDFLWRLCGDGSASVGLAKMLALSGTAIEETLRAEERLHGDPPLEDYDFLDPRLDECFGAVCSMFDGWMHNERGFLNRSRWVRLQVEAFRRFYGRSTEAVAARKTLHQIVSSANRYLLDTVASVAVATGSGSSGREVCEEIEAAAVERHDKFCADLHALASEVDSLAGVRP